VGIINKGVRGGGVGGVGGVGGYHKKTDGEGAPLVMKWRVSAHISSLLPVCPRCASPVEGGAA
jgi:hypothetical protein